MNHKSEFIKKYNESVANKNDEYTFLRVLSYKEKQRFVGAMSSNVALNCLESGSIKTLDWVRILSNIELETEYYVYRLAYWNECGGSSKITSFKSNNMALVCIISGLKNEMSDLKKPRLLLLIKNNKIQIVDKIKPSYWSNSYYELDETENVLM